MDCLTDTSCLTSLLDTLNTLAAIIDFCGLVLFGDLWSPIGPDVAARMDALAQFFDPVSLDDQSNCIQYAKVVKADA